MSKLVLGVNVGGPRHFLDGKPVHCGAGLEMQVPGGKWVPVRYEASLYPGDVRVYLYANPWSVPRQHEALPGEWCNRCEGKAWDECEPDWGPTVVVASRPGDFKETPRVELRWPVRE